MVNTYLLYYVEYYYYIKAYISLRPVFKDDPYLPEIDGCHEVEECSQQHLYAHKNFNTDRNKDQLKMQQIISSL